MRSILVVNPKGGCGKTTIATNLATYYSVWGMSTGLVDLDPQQSAMDWLRVRPKSENPIQGFNGLKGKIYPKPDTERMIYDCPARTNTAKVASLIKQVDVVIIPVMPSAIDMRVAAKFIADIVSRVRKSNQHAVMGVVANRTQKNYQSYTALLSFLKALDVPFVGTIRNSQHYVKAADTGVGIFEMELADVKADMKEWEPIINWVEGKRVLK
ncbi:ParA family protein [Arenicella xantha]|uniref:Chromosome partitioning protein n=1 Tax=Arenicella xantha TaxID=644221 RepID=A0A395JHC1_9GAMM|nr:ParA family protein [Arenicella xantha]RBP48939.1 chromosome partitioning protein [Arenicella xantha]